MWKTIGTVRSGEDASIRSNRSRLDITTEPFHKSLKKRQHDSLERNRSFCYSYFEKRRNTLNVSMGSNKSDKSLRDVLGKEDIFTEMRKAGGQQSRMGSRVQEKQNPQTERSDKTRKDNTKKALSKVNTLKKEQMRLKQTLQNEFNTFKNMFYQLEDRLHQEEQAKQPIVENAVSVDEEFLRVIIAEALNVEQYFIEMDRKKSAIMDRLSE